MCQLPSFQWCSYRRLTNRMWDSETVASPIRWLAWKGCKQTSVVLELLLSHTRLTLIQRSRLSVLVIMWNELLFWWELFFTQVRKFRECRRKNAEEEDEEVREVTPLGFGHRLKNRVVTFTYEWNDWQHHPCPKLSVWLGQIRIFLKIIFMILCNVCLSYCSIWPLKSLFP